VSRSRDQSRPITKFEVIEQSPAELLIILRIFAHGMSRCDLDLWPRTFTTLWRSCV